MSELPRRHYSARSVALYATLQSLVLVFCWGWFGVWWSEAFFLYDFSQIEWWLLFGTALAALYGLRPSLEKAIDAAWIGKATSKTVAEEKISQLRPVKRRVDAVFTILLLIALVVVLVAQGANVLHQMLVPNSQ